MKFKPPPLRSTHINQQSHSHRAFALKDSMVIATVAAASTSSCEMGEKECPLCMEPFELDDVSFYPCACEYQICRFCWHRIRTDENGLCPACRQPYPENPVNFKPLSAEDLQRHKNEKRSKELQKKQKVTDNRKHLQNLRVVQKNLVFVVGLPQRIADSEVLRQPSYFGCFGRIQKIMVNKESTYIGPQGPSAGAYITYYRSDDSLKAIQGANNMQLADGFTLKASLGTTKYCSNFLKNLPCTKPDCMYLHEVGDMEASFTKEDMQQNKHAEYEKRLLDNLTCNVNNSRSQHSSGEAEWPADEFLTALQQKQAQEIASLHSTASAPSISTPNNSNNLAPRHARQQRQRGGAANGESKQRRRGASATQRRGNRRGSRSRSPSSSIPSPTKGPSTRRTQHGGGGGGGGAGGRHRRQSGGDGQQGRHKSAGEPTHARRRRSLVADDDEGAEKKENVPVASPPSLLATMSTPLLQQQQPAPTCLDDDDEDTDIAALLRATVLSSCGGSGQQEQQQQQRREAFGREVQEQDSLFGIAPSDHSPLHNTTPSAQPQQQQPTDWEALFGFGNRDRSRFVQHAVPDVTAGRGMEASGVKSDDELGFDPIAESSKGLETLLNEERTDLYPVTGGLSGPTTGGGLPFEDPAIVAMAQRRRTSSSEQSDFTSRANLHGIRIGEGALLEQRLKATRSVFDTSATLSHGQYGAEYSNTVQQQQTSQNYGQYNNARQTPVSTDGGSGGGPSSFERGTFICDELRQLLPNVNITFQPPPSSTSGMQQSQLHSRSSTSLSTMSHGSRGPPHPPSKSSSQMSCFTTMAGEFNRQASSPQLIGAQQQVSPLPHQNGISGSIGSTGSSGGSGAATYNYGAPFNNGSNPCWPPPPQLRGMPPPPPHMLGHNARPAPTPHSPGGRGRWPPPMPPPPLGTSPHSPPPFPCVPPPFMVPPRGPPVGMPPPMRGMRMMHGDSRKTSGSVGPPPMPPHYRGPPPPPSAPWANVPPDSYNSAPTN